MSEKKKTSVLQLALFIMSFYLSLQAFISAFEVKRHTCLRQT
jgi:hypothetical protein